MLLTSDFFDNTNIVNDERNNFNIYPKSTDLVSLLSWNQINAKLKEAIKKVLYSKNPWLEEENKAVIKSLQEENLHLADYIQEMDTLGGLVNQQEIVNKAEQLYSQDKLNFKAKLKEEKLDSHAIIKEASNLAGKELIEYITTRDKVISQFELLDLNKESDEEIIRGHFLRRGLSGHDYSPVPVKENSLWLIDDKFMTYSYVASEKAINTLLDSIGFDKIDSADRFDIGIYSNTADAKRVVLIEFKKFTANKYDNSKGIDQLFTYADQLSEAGVNEIYLYLIADIDEGFKNILTKARKFTKIFSQDGEVYQGSFEGINAYVQVISPKALLSDARARNKTFIDMVKSMVTHDPKD